ncbi:MAG: ornithine--oxo-acid transaminase [Firmicutes bacterium]|nr:ornithine--oxo-acid transaminase [Bacillota bacterium]
MARTEAFIREVEEYSARNYNPLPVVIERGEGVWVYDVEGREYLDMLSAYSALNQGHRHPKIIQALLEQASKITLTSRAFHNETMGPFLHKLCEVTGYEKALPMNTGAEAVETALKAARKWGLLKKGVPENQGEIIVCENNFHGRTVTIVSFSSEEQYRHGFGPFTPGFVLVPFGDAEALEQAITPNTVAVLAEPIQGEGGVLVPPQGYLAQMRELTRKHNVLMMLDEIQTGLGRTGRLFAYEYEEAKPDVLILGKALGGGVYPVSAVLASEEVMGVFGPGDHGSTFGGNPLGAAVAKAALEVLLEEDLPARAQELGSYFRERLQTMNSPYVQEIRGKGLLIGVEVKRAYGSARPFCERLMAEGLLCKETHEQTIRFAPPLVITREEIDWALERIQKVLGA